MHTHHFKIMSTLFNIIFEILALKVASNKFAACKAAFRVTPIILFIILLPSSFGQLTLYKPIPTSDVDNLFNAVTKPTYYYDNDILVPSPLLVCEDPTYATNCLQFIIAFTTFYLPAIAVLLETGKKDKLCRRISYYYVVIMYITLLLCATACNLPHGYIDIFVYIIVPICPVVYVYAFVYTVKNALRIFNWICMLSKNSISKIRTESSVKELGLRIPKNSSLRPENDPNSSYSRGIKNAKIRYHHEEKKRFNSEQTRARKTRTKNKERKEFPEPTARDFDRYKWYGKVPKFKTESSIPISMYIDVFATLYSKETLPTKIALLRHKCEIIFKNNDKLKGTFEEAIFKIFASFLMRLSDDSANHTEYLVRLVEELSSLDKRLVLSITSDIISFLTVVATCEHSSSVTEEAVLILRKYTDIPLLDDLAPLMSAWNSARMHYNEPKLSTESFLAEYANMLDDLGFSEFVNYGVVFLSAISKLKLLPDFLEEFLQKWFPFVPIVGDLIAIKKMTSSLLHIADGIIDVIDNKITARQLVMGDCLTPQLIEDAKSILQYEDRAVTGVVTDGYISAKEYCLKCEYALEKMATNLSRVKKNTRIRAAYLDVQSDLQRSYLEVSSRLYSERREAPFVIYLYGTPGVGKGFIIDMILQTYCVSLGVKYDQSMVYHRGPADEYWEGYYPFAKWFIHMSEVASDSADILKKVGDQRISELTSLADTQPYHVNMAFAGKGKVFAIPKGIIADSNVPDMGVAHHRACPAAYLRRPLFIDASIHPDYLISGSTQLDPSSLPDDYFSPEAYRFSIRKYHANGAKNSTPVYEAIDITWEELDKYLRAYYESFVGHESTLKKKFQDYIDSRNEGLRDLHTESDYVGWFNYIALLPVFFFFSPILTLLCVIVTLLFTICFKKELYVSMLFLYTRHSYMRFKNTTKSFLKNLYHEYFLKYYMLSIKHSEDMTKETALSALALLGACGVILYSYRRERLKTEAELCDDLKEYEEKIDASNSYPRVKTQNHAIWNRIFNTFSPSHKGGFDDGVLNLLTSMRTISVFTGDKYITHSASTMGFGVTSDLIIFNRHPLGKEIEKASICIHSANEQDKSQIHIQMGDAIYYDMGNDLILLKHPSLRFKDRLKHFVSKDAIVSNNADALIDGYRTRVNRVDDPLTAEDPLCGSVTFTGMYSYHWPNHKPGSCGTPLVAMIGNGQTIIGFHSVGDTASTGYARAVTREEIEGAVSNLMARSPLGPAVCESFYFPNNLTVPGLKSPWRFEDINQLKLIGTLPGNVMVNNKSNLKPTIFKPHLKEIFKGFFHMPDERYGKPMMRPVITKDGNYVSPYNNWYKKADHIQFSQNKDVLQRTISIMTDRFTSGLTHLESTIRPLTVKVAINGAPHDPFLGRMTANASAGFGWKGKKQKYIPIDNDVLDEVQRMPVADLEDKLIEMFERYSTNESYNICYSAKMKDEPRPLQKCIDGKTRLFFVSPIEQVIFARMFLAPLYTLMVEHGDLFCTSVGINAHEDWDRLIRSFKDFSPFIMEGDISGFDTHTAILCRAGVIEVIINLLKYLGYNDFSLSITRSFLSDGLHTFVELANDIFIAVGLQPSGKYGTAEDNSLLLLFKLVYWYVYTTNQDDFFDNVLPRTYGDDCLIAIKEDYTEILNNNSLKDFYASHMNIVYTAANKSLSMNDFNDIMECSYLKRNTIYSERFGRYVGALNVNSMYKMLEWMIPSSFVTEEEQILSMTESFLWEAFFHLDPNEHMLLRDKLQNIILLAFPLSDVSKLPSYSKICGRLGWNIQQKISGVTESGVSKADARAGRNGYDILVHNKNQNDTLRTWEGCQLRENLSPTETKQEERKVSEALPNYHPHLLRTTYKNAALSSVPSAIRGFKQLKDDIINSKLREFEKLATIPESTRYVTESSIEPIIEVGAVESGKMDVVHNMNDIGGEESTVSAATVTRTRPAGQKEIQGIADFLERNVEISNFVIPISAPADVSVQLKVWDIITLEPSMRAKLKNFAYLNCDLELTINVSGSPFAYGKLLLSYQPYPLRNDTLRVLLQRMSVDPITYRPLLLNYLSQAPGAKVLDVKDNQPLKMHVPFISPKPMHRLFNTSASVLTDATSYHDCEDAGTLFIYSINQSKSASSASTDLSVYIYGRMKDVELGTLTSTYTQITTEAKDNEWSSGPIERTSAAISTFLGNLSIMQPEFAPLAVPGSMVFQGVSGLASYFGWSKPVEENKIIFVRETPYANGALTIGNDSAFRLTMDPKQALTVDQSYISDNVDELVISEISRRSAYLTTFPWNDTNAVMATPLWECAVTPQLHSYAEVLSRAYLQPTPCAFATAPFKYWRGTMEFTIEVVCSAQHRGKLAIVYEPNVSQSALISTNVQPNKQYMQVLDIQSAQTITLCIGWAAPYPWLKTNGNKATLVTNYGTSITTLPSWEGYANGYIRIVPFTRLQSPDGSDISVNVYVSCPDLQVQGPYQNGLPTDRIALFTESKVSSFDKSMTPVTCFDLNESSAKTDYINLDYFGEHISSFRSLLKRYQLHKTFTRASGGTTTTDMILNIQPSQEVAWNSSGRMSLYDYLRYAYLGVRGSVRYRVNLSTNVPYSLPEGLEIIVGLRDPENTYSTEVYIGASTGLYSNLTGATKFYLEKGGVNIDLPFYSNNLFLFPCASDYVGANQAGNMELEWFRSFYIQTDYNPIGSGAIASVDLATGEDFSFMRFQGAVPFTASTV